MKNIKLITGLMAGCIFYSFTISASWYAKTVDVISVCSSSGFYIHGNAAIQPHIDSKKCTFIEGCTLRDRGAEGVIGWDLGGPYPACDSAWTYYECDDTVPKTGLSGVSEKTKAEMNTDISNCYPLGKSIPQPVGTAIPSWDRTLP